MTAAGALGAGGQRTSRNGGPSVFRAQRGKRGGGRAWGPGRGCTSWLSDQPRAWPANRWASSHHLQTGQQTDPEAPATDPAGGTAPRALSATSSRGGSTLTEAQAPPGGWGSAAGPPTPPAAGSKLSRHPPSPTLEHSDPRWPALPTGTPVWWSAPPQRGHLGGHPGCQW